MNLVHQGNEVGTLCCSFVTSCSTQRKVGIAMINVDITKEYKVGLNSSVKIQMMLAGFADSWLLGASVGV